MTNLASLFYVLGLVLILSGVQCIYHPNPWHYGHDNPLLPKTMPRPLPYNSSGGKLIPRNVWIAVRNVSDERPRHLADFVKRNANWKVYYCGNKEKDEFIETVYANTSILWAYNILNPLIGTAKVELWRLAVLYAYGGLYMDDDANIENPLDDIVKPLDRFIGGKEGYNVDDRCYVDSYHLSNHTFISRFGLQAMKKDLFGGRFFFNWAMMSTPRHELMRRSLMYGVDLIRREYFSESVVKMHINDHRGKLLMCATTFPITLAAREMVLEHLNATGTTTQSHQITPPAAEDTTTLRLIGNATSHMRTSSTSSDSSAAGDTIINSSIKNSTLQNTISKRNASASTSSAAAEIAAVEAAEAAMGIRIGGHNWVEYGAVMKAWYNDNNPGHWVKVIHKKRVSYLRAYAPPRTDIYEGKPVQSPGMREIYLVYNGTRHALPDFATFVKLKFDLDNVLSIPHGVMDLIPKGPPVKSLALAT